MSLRVRGDGEFADIAHFPGAFDVDGLVAVRTVCLHFAFGVATMRWLAAICTG